MSILQLAAGQTEVVGEANLAASGVYRDVRLGPYSRLVLEGVAARLDGVTLARVGTRSIELLAGASLTVGELFFASIGASIVYRIGPGCTLALDANLAEPEIIENTTIEFASGGTGTLVFAPFANPEWRALPVLAGWQEGDTVELAPSRPGNLRLEGGRLVRTACSPD